MTETGEYAVGYFRDAYGGNRGLYSGGVLLATGFMEREQAEQELAYIRYATDREDEYFLVQLRDPETPCPCGHPEMTIQDCVGECPFPKGTEEE